MYGWRHFAKSDMGKSAGWLDRLLGRPEVSEVKVKNPEPRRKAIAAAKKIVKKMQARDAAAQLADGWRKERRNEPFLSEDDLMSMMMDDDASWADFDRSLARATKRQSHK